MNCGIWTRVHELGAGAGSCLSFGGQDMRSLGELKLEMVRAIGHLGLFVCLFVSRLVQTKVEARASVSCLVWIAN